MINIKCKHSIAFLINYHFNLIIGFLSNNQPKNIKVMYHLVTVQARIVEMVNKREVIQETRIRGKLNRIKF